MSNKSGIRFREMTYGSYAFYWEVAEDGYGLLDGSTHTFLGENPFGFPNKDDSSKKLEESHNPPPWLVPKGDMARLYAPLSNPTLHREFACLNSEESIIKFANKYGLLGALRVGITPVGGGALLWGESLERWRNESREIGATLAVWDMVQRKEAGKLGQLVKWPSDRNVIIEMKIRYDKDRGEWQVQPCSPLKDKWLPSQHSHTAMIASSLINSGLLSRWQQRERVEPAKYYVLRAVNERLRGHVTPQVLLPDNKEDLPREVYLWPDTLLAAIWVLFLFEVMGQIRVRMCERKGCEKWIEMGNSRRKYCDAACRVAAMRQRKPQKGGRP